MFLESSAKAREQFEEIELFFQANKPELDRLRAQREQETGGKKKGVLGNMRSGVKSMMGLKKAKDGKEVTAD